jgi:hypothetical protein
MAENIDYNDE